MKKLNEVNNNLIYEELCEQGKNVELIDNDIYKSKKFENLEIDLSRIFN